jgi:type I restriction enzyme M protein
MLQNNPELKNKISQLWNKFWSGGISNPLTAIEQITYLLFMKRMDELDAKRAADAAWLEQPYTSRFDGQWIPFEYRNHDKPEQFAVNRRSLRWSEWEHMQAEDMLTHVQSRVFPFLKDLNGAESRFTHHMKNAVFIIPKPSLLVEAVKTIDEIFAVMEKDSQEHGQAFQDIQGDVYEMLLAEIATAGKNGQFRTPRHIIKLMAELAQPQLGQQIADPACGTGGFLLGAYQYIVTQLARRAGTKGLEPDEDGFIRTSVAAALSEDARTILQQTLHGYDIDATMVRLGLMNLMMHGIDDPDIDYTDTLSKAYNEEAVYDLVLANPPFTGSIDKGDINEALRLNTTKTELLFVENIYRLLKKGGSACVIVPQGVLFSSAGAFKELRQLLVERCDLKAVITMPSGVFKPYAGVSTAILLFTKVWGRQDKVAKPATEHVWFYDMQADGYSLDDKRTKKPGDFGDLQDIVARYHARSAKQNTDRVSRCFMVAYKAIKAEGFDLSFSRYRENVFEEVVYEKPSVILDRLIRAEVGELEEVELAKLEGGIVGELLALKGIVG